MLSNSQIWCGGSGGLRVPSDECFFWLTGYFMESSAGYVFFGLVELEKL